MSPDVHPADYRIVTAKPFLNVRADPEKSAARVGTLSFASICLVLESCALNWKKIAFEGGTAFVHGNYLRSFWWQAWPTRHYQINQAFGANPRNYERFGLPGHEGLDIKAPLGSPIYAVADGLVYLVSDRRKDGRLSNYGWHVRIQHSHCNEIIYAHLADDEFLVGRWLPVYAGQRIGTSGATGNVWPTGSAGAHLHITMKDDTGTPNWPGRIIDPTIYADLYLAMARRMEEEKKWIDESKKKLKDRRIEEKKEGAAP